MRLFWNRSDSGCWKTTLKGTGLDGLCSAPASAIRRSLLLPQVVRVFWSSEHEPGKSPIHLAFTAPSKESVDQFHAAGLKLGARSNGEPGERRKPFYCAFLIDPDGNNLEAGVYLTT